MFTSKPLRAFLLVVSFLWIFPAVAQDSSQSKCLPLDLSKPTMLRLVGKFVSADAEHSTVTFQNQMGQTKTWPVENDMSVFDRLKVGEPVALSFAASSSVTTPRVFATSAADAPGCACNTHGNAPVPNGCSGSCEGTCPADYPHCKLVSGNYGFYCGCTK